MTGENETPTEEPKKEEKIQAEQIKKINDDGQGNAFDMALKVAERLEGKRQQLLEYEKQIDIKMNDFKNFLKNTEIQGKSFAGQPEKTPEQKSMESAMKLLEGTGLNPFK